MPQKLVTPTVEAGDDVTVKTDGDIHMIQTAVNIAAGTGGGGIGASLGVLIAKSTNVARIGSNANVTARDDILSKLKGYQAVPEYMVFR